MTRPSRAGGFTLIELLVVVAIIGLLLGLLLPSLSHARRNARLAVCLSNMRQITLAVRMYLPENADAYPQTMETQSTGVPTTVSWWAIENYQRAIEPYIQQDRGGVERDGFSAGKRTVWFDPGDPDRDLPAMWGSFSDNGLVTGVDRRDDEIARPAETVYATLRHANWSAVIGVPVPEPLPTNDLAHPFWQSEFFDMCLDPWAETQDENDEYHWTRGRALPPRSLFADHPRAAEWDQQIDGRFPNADPQGPRYGDGQPYAFCDGHAAFMKFEQTYAFPESNFWDVE